MSQFKQILSKCLSHVTIFAVLAFLTQGAFFSSSDPDSSHDHMSQHDNAQTHHGLQDFMAEEPSTSEQEAKPLPKNDSTAKVFFVRSLPKLMAVRHSSHCGDSSYRAMAQALRLTTHLFSQGPPSPA